jgi:hypothetical protein
MHRRPPATGLTSAMWRLIPPMLVPIDAVVSTQRVFGDVPSEYIVGPSFSGDSYAHVVVVDGRWLIEDGHHRYQAAKQAGEILFPARVLVLAKELIPDDWCCPASACVDRDAV